VGSINLIPTGRQMHAKRKWGDFLIQTAAFILAVRTIMLVAYPWLLNHSISYALISDRFHHYHVGLALLLAGVIFHRQLKAHLPLLLAFSLALVLEEYLVILYQLGVQIPYNYLSPSDNFVVYLTGLTGVMVGGFLKSASLRR